MKTTQYLINQDSADICYNTSLSFKLRYWKVCTKLLKNCSEKWWLFWLFCFRNFRSLISLFHNKLKPGSRIENIQFLPNVCYPTLWRNNLLDNSLEFITFGFGTVLFDVIVKRFQYENSDLTQQFNLEFLKKLLKDTCVNILVPQVVWSIHVCIILFSQKKQKFKQIKKSLFIPSQVNLHTS